MYAAHDAEEDTQGVHWIWWVLWLVLFYPAILIVAFVHIRKLNRAINFYRSKSPFYGPVKYDGL